MAASAENLNSPLTSLRGKLRLTSKVSSEEVLKKALAKLEEFEKSMALLSNQLDKANSDNDASHAHVTQLNDMLDASNKKYTTEFQDAQTKHTKQWEELQKKISDTNGPLLDLTQKNKSLNADLSECQKKLAAAEQQLSGLKQTNRVQLTEIQQRRDEIKILNAREGKMSAELKSKRDECTSFLDKITQAESKLKTLEKNSQVQQSELEREREVIVSLKATEKKNSEELKSKQNSLVGVQENLAQATKQLKALEAVNNAQLKTIEQQKSDIFALQVEQERISASLKEEIDLLRISISNVDLQLKKKDEELRDSQASMREARTLAAKAIADKAVSVKKAEDELRTEIKKFNLKILALQTEHQAQILVLQNAMKAADADEAAAVAAKKAMDLRASTADAKPSFLPGFQAGMGGKNSSQAAHAAGIGNPASTTHSAEALAKAAAANAASIDSKDNASDGPRKK